MYAPSYILFPVNDNNPATGTDTLSSFLSSSAKKLNFLYNNSCVQVLTQVPDSKYLVFLPEFCSWQEKHKSSPECKKLTLLDITLVSAIK